MRILVTGSNGQLGRCLQDVLSLPEYEVTALDLPDLDITDTSAVASCIASDRPDVVVNAAAYTAVDRAETEQELAYVVNAKGPEILAIECARNDIPLVHISTDYVFDGTKTEPYLPTDKASPTGVYGQSKLAGETAVISSGVNGVIIRTAWVFSEYGQNFLKTMLRIGAERDSINVVADQVGSPTYAGDLALAIKSALPALHAHNGAQIFHYAGHPACSWFEFAQYIFSTAVKVGVIDRAPLLTPIPTEQYPTPARRPANSVLDSSAFTQVFGVSPCDWQKGVQSVLLRLQAEEDL